MIIKEAVYKKVKVDQKQEVEPAMYGCDECGEPLSLDEAYLDVSHLHSSGVSVAEEIRYQIRKRTGLTASAGIAISRGTATFAVGKPIVRPRSSPPTTGPRIS